jgi:hypothetical protein
VNNSEIKSGNANTAFTLPKEPSVVNEHFKPIQTKTQVKSYLSLSFYINVLMNFVVESTSIY